MLEANPQSYSRDLNSNLLLAGLTKAQLALLAPHLEPVELSHAMQVEAPGAPIRFAYFPASGLASVIAQDRAGLRVEAGLFGREGMTALALVMGDDRSPNETTFQIAGAGHRITVKALREAMTAQPGLRDRFLLFAHAFSIQLGQTALANAKHTIEARLARWLLMCHDRVEGDDLRITHEFLAVMLGVRRAGVTVAIHVLEGRHLIKARRGCIRVLDRAGLEAATLGSYGVTEDEYARLMDVSISRAKRANEVAE